MSMNRGLAFTVLLLILTTDSVAQSSTTVPADWKKVDACGVSVYMPSDMEEPKDILRCGMTCSRTYRNNTIKLWFEFFEPPSSFETPSHTAPDVDPYDFLAALPGITDYQKVNTTVDGESAKSTTFYDSQGIEGGNPYYINFLKFPSIRADTRRGGVTIVSEDLLSRNVAAKIISTIQFTDTQGDELKSLEIWTSVSPSH